MKKNYSKPEMVIDEYKIAQNDFITTSDDDLHDVGTDA